MRWALGIGYLFGFLAFVVGGSIMVESLTSALTVERLLTGIGWLLVSICFMVFITALNTSEPTE
jgi:hypothetical protein